MKATKQQEGIINFNDNCVVIAAPGSGKTFVISQKIKLNLKLLEEHQGVIAISYTNKASLELKRRSLSLGENPKSSFFGTIDKFYLSEIIIPFGKHLFGIPKSEFKIIKKDSLSQNELSNVDWIDRTINLKELTDDKIDILKDYFVDNTILIESIGVLANYIFVSSIACRKYIKAKYKYLYIDEYQDSGNEQHNLFLRIQQMGITSIAVGDINQSIFAFSGKDSKYLNDLQRNPLFKTFRLTKNHRCHPSIINYSNYLLDRDTVLLSTEHNLIFFYRVEGYETNIAKWIDDKLETFRKALGIQDNNKIALLSKNTRTAKLLSQNLKTPNKFLSSNILDFDLNIWSGIFSSLLFYLFDPSSSFIDVIETFSSFDNFNKSERKKFQVYKNEMGLIIQSIDSDYNRLKDIFIEIANIIAPNLRNNESVDLLGEVLQDVEKLKTYAPTKPSELNILTIHKAKGLEYDLVIHLDLHKWIFPQMKPGPNNDFNNPIYTDWQQDLNLHYVAVTRAKKACILISSTERTNHKGEIKIGEDSEFIWLNDINDLRFKRKTHRTG